MNSNILQLKDHSNSLYYYALLGTEEIEIMGMLSGPFGWQEAESKLKTRFLVLVCGFHSSSVTANL